MQGEPTLDVNAGSREERRPAPPLLRAVTLAGILALLLPGGLVWPTAAAAPPTAKALYERAVALDDQARARLEAPGAREAEVLAAVRRAVDAYRQVVWTYPRSGYCDNALWQGAQLSAAAYARFGQDRERTAALSQFSSLISEYPSSPFVTRARAERTRVNSPRPAPAPDDAPLVLISDVTRQPVPDGVEIAIVLDGPVTFTEERLSGPARVFFDLKPTRTVEALREAVLRFDGALVRQVRIGHHPDHVTRVVLDLEGARSYEARLEQNPPRLVVRCMTGAPVDAPPAVEPTAAAAGPPVPPADAPPAAAAPPGASASTDQPTSPAASSAVGAPPPAGVPQAPSSNVSGGFSIARQLGLGASRIVVDAGHGGHDTGALGTGITEAAVALDIALRLERLLAKEPGVEVILTRRTDVFIPLQERGEIANREAADLFVSIHANASRNRAATGVETYLLNFATSSDAAAVAARENSSSALTMSRLDDLVKKIALGNKVNESRDLASYVQNSLVKRLRPVNKGLRDLGVKQAPFVVLVGAAMPSILVEVSFISNRTEGRLLATPAYRQRVAEGILDGVRRYLGSLKKVKIADGSPGDGSSTGGSPTR